MYFQALRKKKKDLVVQSKQVGAEGEQSSKIKVDVSGAVNNPGVYGLSEGDRVEDALKMAGGFSSEADPEWVAKSINLASKITDGQKIYIYAKSETSSTSSTLGSSSVSGKVNINFSSSKELDTLPGVGEVTAGKIISGRPYNSVEDLLNKKVVGKATFEKIKDLVSVN